MKSEAVTKRFTRKPQQAPQLEAMAVDTMRDTRSAVNLSQVTSCSQKQSE